MVIGVWVLLDRERTQERATTEYTEDTEKLPELKEPDKSAQSEDESSQPPSDAVLTLIDPETDYQTRLGAMRKLGYEIPPQDIDALKDFLVADIPSDVKIPRGAYNSIRNDLYEVLLRQKDMPEGLGDLLTGVVNNPDQDGMWRNYCIQFMPEFYAKAKGTTKEESSVNSVASSAAGGERAELQSVRESLWNALGERENSNAGTALLGLDKLSRNHPEFDREQIDAAMLDLASDQEASVANRITALRLCGEQGNTGALETARTLAQNGDTTMLRCAAIATLGELGTEEDLVLLETYAASTDERIQRIAQNSLAKLAAE